MEHTAFYQCPSGDFTCPYWTPSGCTLEDPAHDCDDYVFYRAGDSEEN